jgi:hypothetical protein
MSTSNDPPEPLRSKRKSIQTKNPNDEAYARPIKKARAQRVISEDEEEELMAAEGIVEVVEIDVEGNEKPGTRRPVRSPSVEVLSPVQPTETDDEELGKHLHPDYRHTTY